MSDRAAIKRCSSLEFSGNKEEIKKNCKNAASPLHVMIQRGIFCSKREKLIKEYNEGIQQESATDRDLIGSFGFTEDSETKVKKSYLNNERCNTPTCNQISSDILGSLDSSLPSPASPCASDKCSFWINTFSNLSKNNSSLSRRSSYSSHTSRRPSASLDTSRRLSNSSFSSSYTSWTKPIAGHKISDSFCPASSILDQDDGDVGTVGIYQDLDSFNKEISRRKLKRLGSKKLRRDSSADTSKDIEDIDDFELDGFDDCDLAEYEDIVFAVDEDVDNNEKDKRQSGAVISPDLAYGSMNGSFEQQDEN